MSTQNPISSDGISIPVTPPVHEVVGATANRLRDLLFQQGRTERFARLPPAAREVYERIRNRRARMNPVAFSLVTAVREMREHG